MDVLDLFSGLGGWAAPFRERGHHVITLDIEESFGTDVQADILTVKPADIVKWFGRRPDIILASPPCETFSTMAMGKNWNGPNSPKTEKADLALRIIEHTILLMRAVEPRMYVIENPRAMLRKMSVMEYLPRRETVWYCRYGGPFAKPTDLWGGFPSAWTPRPQCHNGNPDHVAAPRGSRTGTQGGSVAQAERRGSLHLTKAAAREYYGTSNPTKLAAMRAVIPYELSLEMCIAAECEQEER